MQRSQRVDLRVPTRGGEPKSGQLWAAWFAHDRSQSVTSGLIGDERGNTRGGELHLISRHRNSNAGAAGHSLVRGATRVYHSRSACIIGGVGSSAVCAFSVNLTKPPWLLPSGASSAQNLSASDLVIFRSLPPHKDRNTDGLRQASLRSQSRRARRARVYWRKSLLVSLHHTS